MLILTRKPRESIMIANEIEIILINFNRTSARLGIQAPKDIVVVRSELLHRTNNETKMLLK